MDKNLKKVLLQQLAKTRELSDKIISTLKNPRYSSGRLIKFGDRPLHVLETTYKEEEFDIVSIPPIKLPESRQTPTAALKDKNPQICWDGVMDLERGERRELGLKMILLHEEEIDEFCRNYLYLGGKENAIRVVKKPKNFII